MSATEAALQPMGVVWYMSHTETEAPAADSAALPARFGRIGPEAVAELAHAMGREDPSLVRERLDRGRRSYAAWMHGQLAAYGWVSFGEEHVGELGLRLRLLPTEAYIWDCLTLPAYRRQGLYAALLRHIALALRAENVRAIWIGADYNNLPSQAGIARAGFTAVADLMTEPPQAGQRPRRARLRGRPGIHETLLAEARRAYMSDRDEIWLFAEQA